MCVWGVSARAFACVCVGGGGVRARCMRASVCIRYLKDYSHVCITYM